MFKSLRILVGGLLLGPTLWAQNTLSVPIEVSQIGYEWGPDTGYFAYSAMASSYSDWGGEPLPVINANLADYDYIEFSLFAPAGMRFRWDPSDGEGGYYNAGPEMFMFYGDSPADYIEAQGVTLTYLDYQGAPMPNLNFEADVSEDGDAFMLVSCSCSWEMTGVAFFTGIVLTIDYSNVGNRGDWEVQMLEPEGFIGLVIDPIFEDPGQRLTLVPVPEPGAYAALAGVTVLAFVGCWRRRLRS